MSVDEEKASLVPRPEEQEEEKGLVPAAHACASLSLI